MSDYKVLHSIFCYPALSSEYGFQPTPKFHNYQTAKFRWPQVPMLFMVGLRPTALLQQHHNIHRKS